MSEHKSVLGGDRDGSSHDHTHKHGDHFNCCTSTLNPSVTQNLDEMEFERGIWQAAIDNNIQRILHLMSNQKVHPNTTDAYGYTALHYAVRSSAFDATKFLIDAGANVNCQTRNNQTTPLHRAIMNDKPETLRIIEYLCSHGADVNLKDSDGMTPLERAKAKQVISQSCAKIIELLEKFSKN